MPYYFAVCDISVQIFVFCYKKLTCVIRLHFTPSCIKIVLTTKKEEVLMADVTLKRKRREKEGGFLMA